MDPDDPFHAAGSNEYSDESDDDDAVILPVCPPAPPTAEDWSGDWDDELVATWHTLVDHCRRCGYPFFSKMRFPDFCRVAYQYSDVYRNDPLGHDPLGHDPV